MISQLDRKLLRDLSRMKGQAMAVALVMACGIAMLVMARSLIHSLDSTRQEYYLTHRFADLFVNLKRAPNPLLERVRLIPGVAAVQGGISAQVTLDLPDLDEPASGNIRSIPDLNDPELNRLFLRAGEWLKPRGRGEILVGEGFAEANRLKPGDSIAMLLNGRRKTFRIAGIVLSPEFIFETRPGAALPDHRTYGIFWMRYDELANAFDLYGAFNTIALTLAPGASERPVVAMIDELLRTYGGQGAYGRKDHPSHIRISDEIRVLSTLSIGFPLVFLSVAAFMTNAVISRLLNLQREQVAILKAFGFSNSAIVWHYLKFSLVMITIGSVIGMFGGVILGGRLVEMYHLFFRFPVLEFQLDHQALLFAVIVGSLAAVVGVLRAVQRAADIPPAEAMRPEPPANYRPAWIERTGIERWFSHTFRIAVRNIERRPVQALFTVLGLSLATGILIVPNCFRDGVAEILGFQWRTVQREDVEVGLIEPNSTRASYDFHHLPGVVAVEPFRNAAVRIRFGHRSRQLGVRGLPPNATHNRVINASRRRIVLPEQGIVVSAKLAEVLHARVGDFLTLESLEGRRTVQSVVLSGLAEDFAGIGAYMDLRALNRFLGEGDLINGASFTIAGDRRSEFLNALKQIPKVSWVSIINSLRRSFEETTAASIRLIQGLYMIFAIVVAFGVVYNNARISLAERSRELATLRVIGFSQREVGSILVTELVLLAALAIPMGLLLGTGFARGILGAVNTETVRVPLILSSSNYAFAATVVALASVISAMLVLRQLNRLNLVGAMRAPE